jgi:hypothetical protein
VVFPSGKLLYKALIAGFSNTPFLYVCVGYTEALSCEAQRQDQHH